LQSNIRIAPEKMLEKNTLAYLSGKKSFVTLAPDRDALEGARHFVRRQFVRPLDGVHDRQEFSGHHQQEDHLQHSEDCRKFPHHVCLRLSLLGEPQLR